MVAVPDLVLLGLLMEAPLHGYEIRQIVDERMQHVARIPPGTIYYTLKKLAGQGLVAMSTERAGNRPERQVYRVTDAGRARFAALLDEALTEDERAYYVLDAALYFFPYVDERRLAAAIGAKRERTRRFRDEVARLTDAYPGKWPFHLEALRRKGEILTAALDEWYAEVERALAGRAARGKTRSKKSPAARAASSTTTAGGPPTTPTAPRSDPPPAKTRATKSTRNAGRAPAKRKVRHAR